jgi:hypothetical protein
MSRSRPLSALLAPALLLAAALPATASAESKIVCVYDPLGKNGPAYAFANDLRLEALSKYGIDIQLAAHVEEKTATADLTAGKCQGAVVTGISARSFGLASATIEAIGALPNYGLLKATIGLLADARLADRMVSSSGYETAGIFPAGMVYLFTRDKTWRKASDIAGKSMSVIAGDPAALAMAKAVGASITTASTASFASMFNRQAVDACYAPATAYSPLELYRGIGTAGGIIDYPLSQLTFQFVVKKSAWPDGFGLWGRQFAASKFDKVRELITKAEAEIKPHLLPIPEADKPGYDEKMRAVRTQLSSTSTGTGTYEGWVLKLMKGLRCKESPSRAECALGDE